MQAACEEVAPVLGAEWHSARHRVQSARCEGSQLIQDEELDLATENAGARSENTGLRDPGEPLKAASLVSARQCNT